MGMLHTLGSGTEAACRAREGAADADSEARRGGRTNNIGRGKVSNMSWFGLMDGAATSVIHCDIARYVSTMQEERKGGHRSLTSASPANNIQPQRRQAM